MISFHNNEYLNHMQMEFESGLVVSICERKESCDGVTVAVFDRKDKRTGGCPVFVTRYFANMLGMKTDLMEIAKVDATMLAKIISAVAMVHDSKTIPEYYRYDEY